jgi:radical SAM protein with 4Fe4S-binding SPASM domain
MLPSDWRELTRALTEDAAQRGIPINGTFELTNRCNLACRMCYIRTPASDRAMKAGELSAEEWVDLARQGVEAGMLFVLLTGGEVFVRPDFFDIYEPMTEMGLIITLFTNGTLITDRIAKRLARRPSNRLEVTIYGATEATYEAVTGRPGSYRRFVRGVEALLNAGLQPKIKTTLSRLNVHEFDEMKAMAEAWGSQFSAGWLLTQRRDGCSSAVSELRFDPEETVDLEMKDEKARENLVKRAAAGDAEDLRRGAFYCSAGKNTFVIGATGDMNPCIDVCLPRARPTEIGFLPAWEQVKQFVASAPVSETCAACELNRYCHWCPAWGLTETGSLTSPVPYLCSIAEERRKRAVAMSAS